MKEIGIDIETYSSLSLADCGVYRYAEAPDFAILLFAYSVDGGEVRCVDMARGEALPDDIRRALTDPSVTKTAFNATFERVCIGRHIYGEPLDPAQWRCTMVAAARLGLPLSLAQCAEVLRLEQGKMGEGKALIRYFSMPHKGKRRMPDDAPDKWELFKRYNMRDVEVERQIARRVKTPAPPEFDERLYAADQRINDRGVMLDRRLAENAARFDSEYRGQLLAEAREITGLDNPNSPTQLKAWLRREAGLAVDSLSKSNLDELEDRLSLIPRARRVIQLRRAMGKTSNKKYEAMLNCVCGDGRIHGLLQFYGAARTGRWAGRLVQVQNLPQNHIDDIDHARRLVKAGDPEDLSLNYANPMRTLSELIRTAFTAKPGRVFHVCDFSAIEARVTAWLAGEQWVLDVFRSGGDIYCATASQMFHRRVEKHGENASLRQKGKIAVLALGYGGGVAALEAMGGSRMGLSRHEMKDIVGRWRDANGRITRFWSIVERAAIRALKTGERVTINRGVEVAAYRGMLTITLPSGRSLCYPRATIAAEHDDGWRGARDVIQYEGLDQTTKKWGSIRTYGGKLTENIVQAMARDILGGVILAAEERGLEIVFHVHDEIVVEARGDQSLKDVEKLFGTPPEWCADLPLKGAGYTTPYYLKD